MPGKERQNCLRRQKQNSSPYLNVASKKGGSQYLLLFHLRKRTEYLRRRKISGCLRSFGAAGRGGGGEVVRGARVASRGDPTWRQKAGGASRSGPTLSEMIPGPYVFFSLPCEWIIIFCCRSLCWSEKTFHWRRTLSWRDGERAGGKGSDDHDDKTMMMIMPMTTMMTTMMTMMMTMTMTLIQVKHCGGGDVSITSCQVNFIIFTFVKDMYHSNSHHWSVLTSYF